jgi:hypothetical protein
LLHVNEAVSAQRLNNSRLKIIDLGKLVTTKVDRSVGHFYPLAMLR